MRGIELAEKFYYEYGKNHFEEMCPELIDKLAFGLCGSGSECFGYDDEISEDHDFEPGFCVFIPDSINSKEEFKLERAYTKLPKEFMGYKRNNVNPVGGNRHGIIRISDFMKEKTGFADGKIDFQDWFYVPESALAESTNGKIFEDNPGIITGIRSSLKYMPDDVRLKKLASHLLNMAQAGQYNYGRCIKRNECAAAQLAVNEFVKSSLQVIFLLNREYMPYYKWTFRALRELPVLSDLYTPLEFILSSNNTEDFAVIKAETIEEISTEIINELKKQELTKAVCNNLETHAYSVNDMISDSDIRNRNILFAL